MKLGVFDSGIGGEAIAARLRAGFPAASVLTVNDHRHVPYGDKSARQVIDLTDHAIQPLLQARCAVIILACNTATALAIHTLRRRYPKQPFIGIEPMLKPAAALTTSGIITVCATPATLASQRYKQLVTTYGAQLDIIEPDCRDWAWRIENNQLNRQQIETTITASLQRGSDVIVLGCTHYHWIKHLIEAVAGDNAQVLEPSSAIVSRVKQLLALPPTAE